jgi:hypothetical protein
MERSVDHKTAFINEIPFRASFIRNLANLNRILENCTTNFTIGMIIKKNSLLRIVKGYFFIILAES